MLSKASEFARISNEYRVYLLSQGYLLDLMSNLYAKISYDFYLELKSSDPYLFYELIHDKSTDPEDGCVGVCNGVKLFVCNQKHDYEFLIKI